MSSEAVTAWSSQDLGTLAEDRDSYYRLAARFAHRRRIAAAYHAGAVAWRRLFELRPGALQADDAETLVPLEPQVCGTRVPTGYRALYRCSDTRTDLSGRYLLGEPAEDECYCPLFEDTLAEDRATWATIPDFLAPASFTSERALYSLFELPDLASSSDEEPSPPPCILKLIETDSKDIFKRVCLGEEFAAASGWCELPDDGPWQFHTSSKKTEPYRPMTPHNSLEWRATSAESCRSSRTVRFVIVPPGTGGVGIAQKVSTKTSTGSITSEDGHTTSMPEKTRSDTVDMLKAEVAALCAAYRAQEVAALPAGTAPPARVSLKSMTLYKSKTTGELGLRHELWTHVESLGEMDFDQITDAMGGILPEGHTLVAASKEDVVAAEVAAEEEEEEDPLGNPGSESDEEDEQMTQDDWNQLEAEVEEQLSQAAGEDSPAAAMEHSEDDASPFPADESDDDAGLGGRDWD